MTQCLVNVKKIPELFQLLKLRLSKNSNSLLKIWPGEKACLTRHITSISYTLKASVAKH